MESRIVMPEERGPGAEYPCLKQNKANKELIVLFTGPGDGVVVSQSKDDFLGTYSDDWEEDFFEPLPFGVKVVLNN